MRRVILILLTATLVGCIALHIRDDRETTRRLVYLERSDRELRSLLTGTDEQLNDQSDQIAKLETDLHDLATGEYHYYGK